MSKVKCRDCEHDCHCQGSGYNADENNCGCGCLECTCKGEKTMEENMGWIKKQWQKFIDWVFKGFYK